MALLQSQYDFIRGSFSLIDVAEKVLPQSFSKLSGSGDNQNVKTQCPFHQETDPSFAIYPDHAHCYACSWHGGIFKFLGDYLGYSHEQTHAYLSGAGLPEHKIPKAEGPQEYEISAPHSLVIAEKWHQALLNNSAAVDYWMSLGFSWQTIVDHKLGWNAEWHRHVIPNTNHVGLYSAKQRRDDDWARRDVESRGKQRLETELADIWEQRQKAALHNNATPKQPTIEDVVSRIHPKYLMLKDSVNWMLGEKTLMNGPIPYVMVFADEKSWMMAEQERCWAICIPGDSRNYSADDVISYWWQPKLEDVPKTLKLRFEQFFKNCGELYFVGDNDQSGMASAERRRKSMGRGRVVSVPQPAKQLENYLREGGSIEEWLPGIPRMPK